MKVLILVLLMVGCVSAQYMDAATLEKLNKKAVWKAVAYDEDKNPISVDTKDMQRMHDLVMFRTKWEKRGTTTFNSVTGNCTSDKLFMVNHFAIYPKSTKLIPEPDADDEEVRVMGKGTIGRMLLDFVCAEAVIIPITVPNSP